jgi:carboxypeptidase family protein
MAHLLKVGGFAHRVAIGGRVVGGEGGGPLGGVAVAIVATPPAFERRLRGLALQHGVAWAGLRARPDRARSAGDGAFCFLDLPAGDYTLSFEPPGGGRWYGPLQQTLRLETDAGGQVGPKLVEVALPATGLRGRVRGLVGGARAALSLARVRVEGSGEGAYSGPDGRFFLTGVEAGARALAVSAEGFLPFRTSAEVGAGRVTDLGDIDLSPAAPA